MYLWTKMSEKSLISKFSSPSKNNSSMLFLREIPVIQFKKRSSKRERKKFKAKDIVLRFVNIIFRILYTANVHF